MARFRTLKPETFADDKLSECSVEARFLFVGLWCFVDDMGRKQYAPKRIKAEVFPADDFSSQQIAAWIHQLEKARVIKLYESNGAEYLWIPHFLRHQKIDRPSHSYLPAHPDDPEPDCRCIACKIVREEENAPRHYKPRIHKPQNVPDDTRRTVDDSTNHRELDEDSSNTRSVVECSVVECNGVKATPTSTPTLSQFPRPDSSSAANQENRRALSRSLDEIAMRMLTLLQLPTNQSLFQIVTSSIKTKARSKNITYEAAAQQIAARAALLATETPPEDWTKWFADSAYEYVPVGDKRLDDRRIEARPICGGSRCNEGWETVKTAAGTILRRCPDCERLWREMSV